MAQYYEIASAKTKAKVALEYIDNILKELSEKYEEYMRIEFFECAEECAKNKIKLIDVKEGYLKILAL